MAGGDLRRRLPVRPADNPFRAQAIDRLRFRTVGESWSEAVERLAAEDWSGAIVAPHGHGKSTALRRLGDELEGRGFEVCRLRIDRHPAPSSLLRAAPAHRILLLDGVERATPWTRWQVVRRSRRHGRVVVTLHREGLLPTWLRLRTSPELLAELIEELNGARIGGERGGPRLDLDELFARHRGDLRECLFELYDRWPELASDCGVPGPEPRRPAEIGRGRYNRPSSPSSDRETVW